MTGTIPARLALFASLSLACTLPLRAITISVQGGWSCTLGAGDLEAGPGSDFVSTRESVPDQAVLSITGAAGAWRVDVKRSDAAWEGALELAIRRTSSGTGSGGVSGGTSYLDVGALDSTLFSGDGDRSDIAVQNRLSGISAALGAATFTTTVTYTVVDE